MGSWMHTSVHVQHEDLYWDLKSKYLKNEGFFVPCSSIPHTFNQKLTSTADDTFQVVSCQRKTNYAGQSTRQVLSLWSPSNMDGQPAIAVTVIAQLIKMISIR